MDSHFDNVGSSLIAVFIVSLTEGWLDIMWHPVEYNNVILGKDINTLPCLYFILIICIGHFFLMSLYDGVIID